MDGLGQQLRTGVLEEEAAGACLQRTVDVLVEVEGGDDDDGQRIGDVGSGELPGCLIPSTNGMRMSSRHTSGRSERAIEMARRPSAASPTTAMPGWASRIMHSPALTMSYFGLSVGLEVLLLAFILRSAWTWPRTARAAAGRDLAEARA